MKQFSDDALTRSNLTIKAAAVMHANAATIASVAANIQEHEILVAVVNKDITFGGAHAIMRGQLIEKVNDFEEDGAWTHIFSAQASIAKIEELCTKWQQLASRRSEAMQRFASS